MKLTRSFELGLAVMVLIARGQPRSAEAISGGAAMRANVAVVGSGNYVSSRDICRKLGVSLTYSQKILRKLVVAGLIKSTPGSGGGFTLAKPANQITITDIVNAVEGGSPTYASSGLLDQLQSNDAVAGGIGKNIERAFQTADLVWLQVLSQTKLSDI